MNDIEFFLAFLCPWIALGLILLFKRNEPIRAIMAGIVTVSFVMTVLCMPIIHYLATRGIIVFNPGTSFGMVFVTPVEIYFGVFAAAFLTGMTLYFLRPRIHPSLTPSKTLKISGGLLFALIGSVGLIMTENMVSRHMGVVMSWAAPILFVEWMFGSSLVWRTKGMFAVAILICAAYLSLVEGIGIAEQYWRIDEQRSFGIYLVNVPVERVAFNLAFSMITCQALEIFWRYFQKSEFNQKDY